MKNKIQKFIVLIAACAFSFTSLAAQSAEKPDALKLYTAGNYKSAIAACEAELKANPNNLDSYAVLCWSLIANKQYSEAEQRGSDARKINPYDVRIMTQFCRPCRL